MFNLCWYQKTTFKLQKCTVLLTLLTKQDLDCNKFLFFLGANKYNFFEHRNYLDAKISKDFLMQKSVNLPLKLRWIIRCLFLTSKLLEKTINSLPQFIISLHSVVCLLSLRVLYLIRTNMPWFLHCYIELSNYAFILNYFSKKLKIWRTFLEKVVNQLTLLIFASG